MYPYEHVNAFVPFPSSSSPYFPSLARIAAASASSALASAFFASSLFRRSASMSVTRRIASRDSGVVTRANASAASSGGRSLASRETRRGRRVRGRNARDARDARDDDDDDARAVARRFAPARETTSSRAGRVIIGCRSDAAHHRARHIGDAFVRLASAACDADVAASRAALETTR